MKRPPLDTEKMGGGPHVPCLYLSSASLDRNAFGVVVGRINGTDASDMRYTNDLVTECQMEGRGDGWTTDQLGLEVSFVADWGHG